MDSEIDHSTHTEGELIEIFGRMDSRYAPEECARLGKHLAELGYVVTQGETGPGFAAPSATKLQALIGSSRPFECDVNFGKVSGASSYLEPTHNDFGFVGSGKLQTNGVSIYLSGRVGHRQGTIPSLQGRQIEIPTRRIVNVESQGRLVRFEYGSEEGDSEAITLQLADDSEAARLIALLPKTRTKDFRPQIKVTTEFTARLIARSPKTPVTYALIATNTLVFIAMLSGGAEWFRPVGDVQIAWGSNFGPYTTDGEWWRLFTSVFIHFGFPHVLLNMVALLLFGPLVERLYGSMTYLLLYLLTGTLGSLGSVAWHPAANSAGASGAIFGICGALLAAQLRAANSFPPDILRATQNSTLLFVGWALYTSFSHQGVDYAAHISGLASGFILGVATAPPVGGEKLYTRRHILGLLPLVPVAVVLFIGGVLWAQRNAASLAGDALYYRTVHWLRAHEHAINTEFNSSLRRDRQNHAALIETLERSVIPFWREAGDRLAAIQLPARSPNSTMLDTLQDISDKRTQAFQLLDQGLRNNDPKVIATAGQELKKIDQMATPNSNPAMTATRDARKPSA